MPDEIVPPEVRALLFECIDSFEQLEVLVFLHAERARSFSAPALAETLRFPPDAVATALHALVTRRLIEALAGASPKRFRFDPRSERALAVEALASCWAAHRYEIVRLLGTYAMERVRNSAARAFADAFLIGRKKKDG